MQHRAADSVAPSPRLRGEGGGEGLTAPIVVFAPHPTPLPVKNGEREQTDRAASCDATSPVHALRCRTSELNAAGLDRSFPFSDLRSHKLASAICTGRGGWQEATNSISRRCG